jgi:hypothetical protein
LNLACHGVAEGEAWNEATAEDPMTILAPSSANLREDARPIPLLAPVTKATFPFNRIIIPPKKSFLLNHFMESGILFILDNSSSNLIQVPRSLKNANFFSSSRKAKFLTTGIH